MGRDFKTRPTVNGAPLALLSEAGDGGGGSQQVIGVAIHEADANYPRPDFPVVHWYGTVEPVNAELNDSWIDPSQPAPITSHFMGVVIHGSDANAARPVGFACVTWVGSVEPVNMEDNDLWEQVS